jgi:hypothetical protein
LLCDAALCTVTGHRNEQPLKPNDSFTLANSCGEPEKESSSLLSVGCSALRRPLQRATRDWSFGVHRISRFNGLQPPVDARSSNRCYAVLFRSTCAERRARRGGSHSEREEAFGFAYLRVLSCAANALPCSVISQPSRRDKLGLSNRRIHPCCSISSMIEEGTRC